MDARGVAQPVEPAAEFEALLAPVLDRAYGTALRLTGAREEAEDLVQEAALHAFRGFHTFARGTNFRAWFLRVLMNCFYQTLRRRRPEVALEELEEEAPTLFLYVQTRDLGMHGAGRDPAQAVMDRLTAEDVGRALDALPQEFREVATLYFVNDLAYQEIATVLGLPVGTVRSRLHRGRKLLQKRLWALAVDAGLATDAREGA